MPSLFRVRYREGELEIEVESSDREYVDAKLDELIERGQQETAGSSKPSDPRSEASGKKKPRRPAEKRKAKITPSDESHRPRSEEMLLGLVNYIKGVEEFTNLEKQILNKRAVLPRILMCLYYAKQHFEDPYMTTGELETVTDQLGVKIDRSNVNRKIKQELKYFTADAVRKRGAIVGYKLNRAGEARLEELLTTDDPEIS